MKRAISQDDWKRTQLRMPQHDYDRVMQYAEKNKISINTAMLTLIDKALILETESQAVADTHVKSTLTLSEVQQIIDRLISPQHRELLKKIEDIQSRLPKNQSIR